MDAPNGNGLSPELRTLHGAETRRGRCLVGLPGHQLLDSLADDSAGNVCVATIVNGGNSVISPAGEVDHVPCDDPLTTNVWLGGDNLSTAFITLSSSGRLISQPRPRPGLRLEY